MIVVAAVLVAAALVAAVAARATGDVFAIDALARRNYRDHPLPTAVGVLVPVATVAVVAGFELVFDPWRASGRDALVDLTALHYHGTEIAALTMGFGLLGLLDDLAGEGQSGGFRGHLAALVSGRWTTGALKLVVGPLVALAVVGGSGLADGRVALVRDAAIVALAANLVNLFDRAPGRAVKVGVIWFAVLAAVTLDARVAPVAIVVGAAIGLLAGDLAERFMLGDAGANPLGAGLGYGMVLTVPDRWRWVVIVGLLVANLASEVVSFGSVIERVPPLRWLDRWGSPHRT